MNRPQSIPANYIETEPGVWVHPSRLPENSMYRFQASNTEVVAKESPPLPKPLLNKRETLWKGILIGRGIGGIMEQAITLRLDPPYKSYTPDLAYPIPAGLCFVEVKGPHRFRRAGIAKAALAAKTYPQFRFELADWTGKEWKESVLSP